VKKKKKKKDFKINSKEIKIKKIKKKDFNQWRKMKDTDH